MYRCKIMLVSKYNSDRQPELSIWPPKPEIITSLELWQIATKFPRQIRDFRWCWAQQMISKIIVTTTNCQKLRDWRAKCPYCNFQLSVVVAIDGGQFRRTRSGRKPHICRWNCTDIYHTVGDINTSDFDGHIAISGYLSMSHLCVDTFFDFGVVENFVYRARIIVILTSDLFGCIWVCDYDCAVCAQNDDLLLLPVLFVILKMYKYRCLHSCLIILPFSVSDIPKNIISVKLCPSVMGVQCWQSQNQSRGRYNQSGHVKPEADIMIHSVALESQSPRGQ